MDVRILSDCRGGDQHLTAGNIYSFPEELAKALIALQRAEAIAPPATEAAVAGVDFIGDPLQPIKRGRKPAKPDED